jgi:hypothetical protein
MAQAALAGRVSAPPELAYLYTERLLYTPLGHAPPCPALLPPGAAARRPPPGELGAAERRARGEAAACGAAARRAMGAGAAPVAGVAGAADGLGGEAVGLWLAALRGAARRGAAAAALWLPPVGDAGRAGLERRAAERFGAAAWGRVRVAGEGEGAACRAAGSDLLLDPPGESAGPALGLAASRRRGGPARRGLGLPRRRGAGPRAARHAPAPCFCCPPPFPDIPPFSVGPGNSSLPLPASSCPLPLTPAS